ncbi:MAG: hypothetical protein HY335_10110 [Deinococcus sp.]|nr:hypothetical protein [Deinococcus sp.]
MFDLFGKKTLAQMTPEQRAKKLASLSFEDRVKEICKCTPPERAVILNDMFSPEMRLRILETMPPFERFDSMVEHNHLLSQRAREELDELKAKLAHTQTELRLAMAKTSQTQRTIAEKEAQSENYERMSVTLYQRGEEASAKEAFARAQRARRDLNMHTEILAQQEKVVAGFRQAFDEVRRLIEDREQQIQEATKNIHVVTALREVYEMMQSLDSSRGLAEGTSRLRELQDQARHYEDMLRATVNVDSVTGAGPLPAPANMERMQLESDFDKFLRERGLKSGEAEEPAKEPAEEGKEQR